MQGFADGVVFDGIVFGEFVALAFFGDDVQQLRAFAPAQVAQGIDQQGQVVAVDGAGVLEAEVFKQRQRLFDVLAFAGVGFDGFFGFLGDFFNGGQLVEHEGGLVFDVVQHAAHIAHHVAGQIFGQGADIGRDRHFVVVEYHQEIGVGHIAGAVERFKGLAGGHRAVADNGNAAGAAAGQAVGYRHAQRGADGCGRMADAEVVVLAFAALGKTGQPAKLAHGVHAVAPSGQDFVRVALVADVPHQMVARGVIHIMQGNGQLHRAEIAGEMAAGLLHAFQQKAAQLGGQLRKLADRQTAQVFGQVYGIEQGSGGGHGVHLGEKTGADYIANRTAALRAQTRFQAA